MSRTILVSGGAGYIGSHVSKALAEAGLTPVCYDTLEKGHAWAVRWGPFERGDIGDAVRLDEVFTRHRPDAVIHLAGYIEVGESVKQPERYLHNNAAKTDTLIAAALRHGADRLVFSSSCAVYGLPQTDLLTEAHPIAPISPYAESKARVERSLTTAADHGLRSASLRYFNAAGADASGEIGEAHEPETPPVAAGRRRCPRSRAPSHRAGHGLRHARTAPVCATSSMSAILPTPTCSLWTGCGCCPSAGGHEAFNLGSGSGYSVRQAVAETARIVGRSVPHQLGPRRPGDSPKLVGDIAKAKRTLGWQPTRDLAAPDRGYTALAAQDAALGEAERQACAGAFRWQRTPHWRRPGAIGGVPGSPTTPMNDEPLSTKCTVMAGASARRTAS
jgi:UDP-glucose 4-epimerase